MAYSKLPNIEFQRAAIFLNREEGIGTSTRDFYQQTPFHPPLKTIPSPLALTGTKDYFTDASQNTEGLVGNVMGVSQTIIAQAPGSQLPSRIIANQLTGVTIMTNFPRGLIKSAKAIEGLKAARAIRDTEGTVDAGMGLVTGGLQTLYGLDSIGIRHLTVHSAFLPTNTTPAIAAKTTLGLLTVIGNILSPILSACIGVWGTFQVWRADKFYEEYKKNGKTFAFLESSVSVSPEKIAEMIEKEEESLQTSGKTALEAAFGSQSIPEGEYWSASLEEKHQWLNIILAKHFQKYPELSSLKELYFSKFSPEAFNALELPTAIGLLLALRNIQKKNAARIERFLGQDCLARIKRAAERGLTARAESRIPSVQKQALAERAELLEKIDSSYAKKQTEYKIAKWLGIAGVSLGIAAFFLTGPYMYALSAVLALVSIGIDIYLLQNAFDNQPGRADKLFITICAVCILLSMAGSLAAFLVFGGGAPLILGLSLSLAAGLIGLCIYGYGYYKTTQQQKKWDEEHPSLEDLAERLERLRIAGRGWHKLDKQSLALFKKLPRTLRRAITEEAAAHSFETVSYRKWDSQSRFGQICLERYLNNRAEYNEITAEQLRRAVKKTAKFFWTQWWYSNKQAFFLEQALIFEELLEAFKGNDLLRAQNAYQKIEESDSDVQAKLYENIRNVFKREESIHSLHEAVKNIHDRTTQRLSA